MKKLPLMACFAFLVIARPIPAEQTSSTPPAVADTQQDDTQRSDDRFSSEQRRRLRGELDGYSRKVYPDREQVEERRRTMQDRFQERLRSGDRNGLGPITRAEAMLRMPWLARHFDEVDTNGDNVISDDEIKAARERSAQEFRERSTPEVVERAPGKREHTAEKRERRRPATDDSEGRSPNAD